MLGSLESPTQACWMARNPTTRLYDKTSLSLSNWNQDLASKLPAMLRMAFDYDPTNWMHMCSTRIKADDSLDTTTLRVAEMGWRPWCKLTFSVSLSISRSPLERKPCTTQPAYLFSRNTVSLNHHLAFCSKARVHSIVYLSAWYRRFCWQLEHVESHAYHALAWANLKHVAHSFHTARCNIARLHSCTHSGCLTWLKAPAATIVASLARDCKGVRRHLCMINGVFGERCRAEHASMHDSACHYHKVLQTAWNASAWRRWFTLRRGRTIR